MKYKIWGKYTTLLLLDEIEAESEDEAIKMFNNKRMSPFPIYQDQIQEVINNLRLKNIVPDPQTSS